MGKVITVASGKGGTGKTTSVAAISSCLAVLGHRTLCVDFDAGLKNLDLALCMSDFTVKDYMDVVNGRLNLKEACSESPHIPNLFFLAAPSDIDHDEKDIAGLKSMFDEARKEFDYCFIDSPSGIGLGFRLAHENADMSIIITTGEGPAVRDSQEAAEVAREIGVGELRLLVNRITAYNLRWLHATVDDVIDTVGVRLIGVIPEDKAVFQALHSNTPLILYRKKLAAYDFLDVARRIAGEDVPLRQK